MPKDINAEIEQLSEDLEKSHQTPQDVLFETIRKLGPDGIRAKLPTLEKSDKELLLNALKEMKKAVEMDKNYAAKYVQGNIKDTILQEDKADDNQDEKLVMESAATVNHQGTPTPGWEGQVIKGKEMSKDQAKDKIIAMEEKEHGTKDPKKLVEAEKKEHKMKKAEDMKDKKCEMKNKDSMKKIKSGKKDEQIEGLKEMKKSVEDQLKEFGVEATPELVKSEMKRLLAEESQDGDAPEMNEGTRAKKENVPALNLASDNKSAQSKVDDKSQGAMKKSVPWSGENDMLKALTGGRNHHFSLEEYVAEVLNTPAPAEPMAKSEKKDDLNDIIAKGGDATWDHVNTERMLKANKEKVSGKVVKSFADNEIAQALGLTEEEAKKILGE